MLSLLIGSSASRDNVLAYKSERMVDLAGGLVCGQYWIDQLVWCSRARSCYRIKEIESGKR